VDLLISVDKVYRLSGNNGQGCARSDGGRLKISSALSEQGHDVVGVGFAWQAQILAKKRRGSEHALSS
jgi:hypothetical protein